MKLCDTKDVPRNVIFFKKMIIWIVTIETYEDHL